MRSAVHINVSGKRATQLKNAHTFSVIHSFEKAWFARCASLSMHKDFWDKEETLKVPRKNINDAIRTLTFLFLHLLCEAKTFS